MCLPCSFCDIIKAYSSALNVVAAKVIFFALSFSFNMKCEPNIWMLRKHGPYV